MSLKEKFISKLLFCPHDVFENHPHDYELQYEDIWIGEKNKLHGWYFPAIEKTNNFIIYFHGTKGNISLYLKGIKKLYQSNANILLVGYQGFGKSHGKALIKNTILDSIRIYDYLIENKNAKPENIGLFGYSYGGAIAIELAMRKKVKGVVIESTFSSLKKVANTHYPILGSAIVSDSTLNLEKNIVKLNIPILIAYAEKDQVVPIENSKRLFKKANEPKYLFEIKNASHHNICDFVTDEYIELIKTVLT